MKRGTRTDRGQRPDDDGRDAADAETFERAMGDVVRLEPDPRGRARQWPRHPPVRPALPDRHDAPPLESEYLADGIDRRELRKLRRGEYRVAARHDLHGMTVAEALDAVRRLVHADQHSGHRCVCIVHGRGLHSERGTSKLKMAVRESLRAQRAVLAYADAPPSDGGPGAVYVLLRR